MKFSLFIFFVVCVISAFCMEIPFSTVPVKTDTNLFSDFVRIAPDDKKPETLKTKAWLWYDEEALYIDFEAEIDNTFSAGMYVPNDNMGKGDFLRIQIITIPQAYYAYYYMAFPSGSMYDCIRKDLAAPDKNWNSEYSYESQYESNLWTVKARFPFKDMRFGFKPPYDWKIILTRFNNASNETYSLPYVVPKMGKEYFTNATDIRLTHQIKRSSDWKFRPYYVKSYDLMTKTDTFDPEHVGMDISFSPSTKTKLKIALNPDFSDVPPDNASNIYNSKYPPWFSENRFFFTEDIDAFGVNYTTFYSRYIAQPQIAVKVTGNSDTWNYGYLCAKDKKTVSNGSVINSDDYYQLASVIKTLPRFYGMISTASRMNTDYYNHIVLAKWDWEFIEKLHIGTSHIVSIRHKEDSFLNEEIDTLGVTHYVPVKFTDDNLGAKFKAQFEANPGNWNILANYVNLQNDLRVDMGILDETGFEDYLLELNYTTEEREQFLRTWSYYNSMSYSNKLDANRSFTYANIYSYISLTLLPKYTILIDASRSREAYESKEYDQWNSSGSVTWNKLENLTISADFEAGKTLVYDICKSKNYYATSLMIWCSAGKKLAGSIDYQHYQYDYNKLYTFITPLDTTYVSLDDSFQIVNAGLDYNFNNSMTLRNGLSITTNDADGPYSNLSFYSNFRYEFKKDWFLYLGYKSRQYQDEPSNQNDMFGHFKRNSASAYLKVSATI